MIGIAFEDLTNKQFGRLTVLGRDIDRDNELRAKGKHGVHWLCKCSCGNPEIKSVDTYSLKSGHTQSCGCYRSEKISERNQKYSTKQNKIIDCGETAILLDEKGNKCLIDKNDLPIVSQWYWRKTAKRGNIDKGYWITNSKHNDGCIQYSIRLHQVIAHIKYGYYDHNELVPDHLSRDTNDNRKCNIRLKTNQKNTHNRGLSKANTSGKTGVSFAKDRKLWVAYITVNAKTVYLGQYQRKEDAIQARKNAEKRYAFTCDENVDFYDTKVV